MIKLKRLPVKPRIVKQQVKIIAIRGKAKLTTLVITEPHTAIQYHAQAILNAPDTILRWNERQRAKYSLRIL